MKFFISNFKWVMFVSGLLTCTMIIGLFSPELSLKSNFGETVNEDVARIVVRNWSALITLMGIMLIYGALVPKVRNLVLVIAGASKMMFITLIFSFGRQFLTFGIGSAVIVDTVMIVLYTVYLFLTLRKNS